MALALTFVPAGKADEPADDEQEPKVLMLRAAEILHGDPAEVDIEKAISLYRNVAERDIAFAQFKLARIYLDGRYIEPDIDTALAWLERAAALGFVEAQLELSGLYETGDLLQQDLVGAYKWLNIAASLSETDFEDRQQALADKMSFLQQTRAEYLARRCIYRRYKDC